MPNHFAPVTKLAVLVQRATEIARRANAEEGYQGQLGILQHRLSKIRSFEKSDAKKRIGVFGAPKRGKSTLLNTLLGHDLLPTSPVPLSTTTIEVERDSSVNNWAVIVDHANGRIERKESDSPGDVAKLLEWFGSRRGPSPARRLRVSGAFLGCRILERGGVLLDTPGAELAFETDSELAEESKRAIEALAETHVVLFCMRADQLGARSDCEFYERHIRSLAPLHVVTMKDKWNEDIGGLIDDVMNKYGLAESATVLVSSKKAAESPGDATIRGDSGMQELEDRILTELDRLTPQRGLLPCLQEFHLLLEDKPLLRPERIHFTNLKHDLVEVGETWRNEACEYISKNPDFWKLA